MNKKALVLLSGGLDSILATRLMLEQGVEVQAVTFSAKLCMCGAKKTGRSAAEEAAQMLGVGLKTVDFTSDFIEIVKSPRYGYGSNVNPCIDCRIYMLNHARGMMADFGASFLVTGEVVGERPMSQRKDVLHLIEKRAGVQGILLRPLSAKLLEPTMLEREGLVDREKLCDIHGRSRKPQMALAEKFGIRKYPNPAGGCLLTDPGFARRVRDAMEHDEFDCCNVAILSVGRQFRLANKARLVVGRDERENELIYSLAGEGDLLIKMDDIQGPLSLLRGDVNDGMMEKAAAITAYHTKLRHADNAEVSVWSKDRRVQRTFGIKPAGSEDVEGLRI